MTYIVVIIIIKNFYCSTLPPTHRQMERSVSRAPDLVLPQLSLFGPDSEEDSSDESVQEDPLGTITAPLSADVSNLMMIDS